MIPMSNQNNQNKPSWEEIQGLSWIFYEEQVLLNLFADILGAILVLTVSNAEMTFSDYDIDKDDIDSYDDKLEKEKRS